MPTGDGQPEFKASERDIWLPYKLVTEIVIYLFKLSTVAVLPAPKALVTGTAREAETDFLF